MSPLRKIFGFIFSATHSRTIGVLIFFVLLATVSLTVIIAQQQQQIRQRAASPIVCNDINTLPDCFDSNTLCDQIGKKCKISNTNTILECQKE